jgi:hypothetical protein
LKEQTEFIYLFVVIGTEPPLHARSYKTRAGSPKSIDDASFLTPAATKRVDSASFKNKLAPEVRKVRPSSASANSSSSMCVSLI